MFNRLLKLGTRPEGVGVSRDVGRTKRPIYPAQRGIALIPLRPSPGQAFCGVLLRYASFLEFSGAWYLDLFEQPVKKEFFRILL